MKLLITELVFSCVITAWEMLHNCCMESTNVCHLWTDVPAQDHWIRFHNYSKFLGFSSEIAFLIWPHKFSFGSRSRDCAGHSIASILLVWNQDAAADWCIWGCFLLKHLCQGLFHLGLRQTWLLRVFGCIHMTHDPGIW